MPCGQRPKATLSHRPFAPESPGRYHADTLMRHISTGSRRSFFSILHSTTDAQAAMMTLRPGQSTSDEPVNEHPRCEQWLFIISGSGKATLGKRRIALRAGSLLLIEKGEAHRIENTGKSPLVTLNFYCPPAYTKSGELKVLARVPTVRSVLRR